MTEAIEKEYEFHGTVLKVEERFRKVYDREKVGTAKVESQMEAELVSIGWFVTLERFGAAMRFGKLKPDIEVGDTLVTTFRKIPKTPSAPAPATTPAPPALSPAAAAKILESTT